LQQQQQPMKEREQMTTESNNYLFDKKRVRVEGGSTSEKTYVFNTSTKRRKNVVLFAFGQTTKLSPKA
jgi:hypothetical protein